MLLEITTKQPHQISNAKRYLMLARMKAQASQAHLDAANHIDNLPDTGFQLALFRRYARQAKRLRADVKRLLIEEEIIAGREFCQNGYTKRGARNLAGNQFRLWYHYDEVFALSDMGDIW